MFFGAPLVYRLHSLTASAALSAVPSGMLGYDIRTLQKAYDLAEPSEGNVLSTAIDQYVDGLKTGDNDEVISALLGMASCVGSTEPPNWLEVSRLFNQYRNGNPSFSWVTTPALGVPTRSQVLGMCRPDPLSPQAGKFLDLCDRYALPISQWETLYVMDLQGGHFEDAAEILDQMKPMLAEVIEAIEYAEGESVLMGNVLLRLGALMHRLYQVGERFEQPDNDLVGWILVVFGMEAVAWIQAGCFERSDNAFGRTRGLLPEAPLGGDDRELYVLITQQTAELFFKRGETALLFGKQEVYFQSLVAGIDILKDLVLAYQSWNQTEKARNIFDRLLRKSDAIQHFRELEDWENVSSLARLRIEMIKSFSAVEPEKQCALLGQAYVLLEEAALRLGKPLEALESYLRADLAWKQAQAEAKKVGHHASFSDYQGQLSRARSILNKELFESNTAKRAAFTSVLAMAHLEEQLLRDPPVFGLLSMGVAEIFDPIFPEIERALVRAGFPINTIAPTGIYRVMQLIDYFELIHPYFSGQLGEWLASVVGFAAPLLAERRPRFIARLERPHPEQLVTYRADGNAVGFFHGSPAEIDALATRWQKRHGTAM